MTEENKPLTSFGAPEEQFMTEPGEEPILTAEVKEEKSPQQEVSEALKEATKLFFQQADFSQESKWDDTLEIVGLPSEDVERSLELVNDAPNQSLVKSADGRKWALAFSKGIENIPSNEAFKTTTQREGSEFKQALESPQGLLAGHYTRLKPVAGKTLTGDAATLRLQTFLGLGTNFNTPLWHTGIWVTLKAPSESELLELQRQINSDKIILGRKSFGFIFTNNNSYLTDRLVNFALSHLFETTLKEGVDLKKLISCNDIPALLWGLACAIYPRGFQYTRACLTDASKCNHVVQERLNLPKLVWPDTRAFNASQIAHMANRRPNSMTLESVQAYQAQMLATQKKQITINKDSSLAFKMTLKVPNIDDHVKSGQRWIGDIVSMVNEALGIDADNDQRNNYIIKQGQASSMRLYGHWVDSIEFEGNSIEDTETIEEELNVLSTDDNIRNDFMSNMKSFIDETAVAVIGIPNYKCPKCGSEEEATLPRFTSVIPIDVYQVFFTLLEQKIQRLSVR